MTLEDLTRYESAAVAATNAKKDASLAVVAMANFYQNIGMGEDPIIQASFQSANAGIKADTGISDAGLINAIGLYSQKYEETFTETKFSDLVNYLSEGYDIPKEAKEALTNYGNVTLMSLMNKMKEKDISDNLKESVQKAISAIGMLKDRKLRAGTLNIINQNVYAQLSQLYPTEKSEESE